MVKATLLTVGLLFLSCAAFAQNPAEPTLDDPLFLQVDTGLVLKINLRTGRALAYAGQLDFGIDPPTYFKSPLRKPTVTFDASNAEDAVLKLRHCRFKMTETGRLLLFHRGKRLLTQLAPDAPHRWFLDSVDKPAILILLDGSDRGLIYWPSVYGDTLKIEGMAKFPLVGGGWHVVPRMEDCQFRRSAAKAVEIWLDGRMVLAETARFSNEYRLVSPAEPGTSAPPAPNGDGR